MICMLCTFIWTFFQVRKRGMVIRSSIDHRGRKLLSTNERLTKVSEKGSQNLGCQVLYDQFNNIHSGTCLRLFANGSLAHWRRLAHCELSQFINQNFFFIVNKCVKVANFSAGNQQMVLVVCLWVLPSSCLLNSGLTAGEPWHNMVQWADVIGITN